MKSKLMMLAAILTLSGCMTEGRVTGWLDDHPAVSARYCADMYPVKTITTVTERVEYDTITLSGGTVQIRDTIPCPDGAQIPVQYDQPCPPVKVVTQTVYRDSVIYMENTAHVRALQADSGRLATQLAISQAGAQEAKKEVSNLRWWLIGAGALLGVGIFLKLKSFI